MYLNNSYTHNKLIRYLLYLVIAVNLVIILSVFLRPRLEFIAKHWGYTHNQIKISRGSSDMPNISWRSFNISYKILDKLNNKKHIIFLNIWYEIKPGAAYEVLYPNELIWNFDNNLERKLNKYKDRKNFAVVFKGSKIPYLCRDRNIIDVIPKEIFICLKK